MKKNYLPGCPDISKKKLFYSIQNNEFKIDIKASLDQIILYENIVGIYNLKNDPLEKKNLRKKMQSDTRIKYLLNTVNERHAYLAQKFLGEKFLEFIINHN